MSAAGRQIPSQAAVAAGEAEPVAEEQREAWLTLQSECRRLAVGHPYWREVDDPTAARRALEDAVG